MVGVCQTTGPCISCDKLASLYRDVHQDRRASEDEDAQADPRREGLGGATVGAVSCRSSSEHIVDNLAAPSLSVQKVCRWHEVVLPRDACGFGVLTVTCSLAAAIDSHISR
jgi:hypothetical protein